jgi:predicted aspartyl protease
MYQTVHDGIVSSYWIRFCRTQLSVWTPAGATLLLTGCLATASVLNEAPHDRQLAPRDSGIKNEYSAEYQDPASPGPSSFLAEKLVSPLTNYSDAYWSALGELDVNTLRSSARTSPEVGFAEGIALLVAGEREKAESAFAVTSWQSTDDNVAVASQIMLARTLLAERKWKALRDMSFSPSLALSNRENSSDLKKWGQAFAGVEDQITTIPAQPVTLQMKITAVGTPTVRVRINGKDYEFWIDTGSSMTVLSSRVVSDANVPIVSPDTLSIGTFESRAPVRPALVARMELGGIVLANVPAIEMDASLMRIKSSAQGVRGPELRVDGIIGWDVIRQFDIVMDYIGGTITLRRPVHLTTNGTTFQNLIWMGKPLVQVTMKSGGTFRFSLDTGAQASVLNASILDELGIGTRTSGGRLSGVGSSGRRTNRVVPSLTMEIAGRLLRLESVIVYGPVYSGLVQSSGILGSDLGRFGKIRIDATNGLFSVGE